MVSLSLPFRIKTPHKSILLQPIQQSQKSLMERRDNLTICQRLIKFFVDGGLKRITLGRPQQQKAMEGHEEDLGEVENVNVDSHVTVVIVDAAIPSKGKAIIKRKVQDVRDVSTVGEKNVTLKSSSDVHQARDRDAGLKAPEPHLDINERSHKFIEHKKALLRKGSGIHTTTKP
ncbi:hypothetical protein QJS04_geneDACA010418 [Acorus gramineus]|uniref:Uncharacterized protein n=1 Tax=Acorus gramineus TaxID=55184 RepID=A0AAV9A1A3_ACOGR|nr:hypothetical protein QJS04_geneDACA010418 [Acorus gramineus]